MTEEYAAQVAAKVTDLQQRIAAALADGERIDAELAGAMTAATGTAEPVVKTSLQDLLLPGDREQHKTPKPGEPSSTPENLDDALNQLAGDPGDGTATPRPGETVDGSAAMPVPLDPAKVQQFKDLALAGRVAPWEIR